MAVSRQGSISLKSASLSLRSRLLNGRSGLFCNSFVGGMMSFLLSDHSESGVQVMFKSEQTVARDVVGSGRESGEVGHVSPVFQGNCQITG